MPSFNGSFSEQARLHAYNLYKSFTLHHQGGIRFPVLEGVSLTVNAGDCVAHTRLPAKTCPARGAGASLLKFNTCRFEGAYYDH